MKKQAKILKVIFMGLLIASTAIISSCKKDAETKPVNFDGKTYEKSNLTMYWDETYNNNTDTNSQVGYGKKNYFIYKAFRFRI